MSAEVDGKRKTISDIVYETGRDCPERRMDGMRFCDREGGAK